MNGTVTVIRFFKRVLEILYILWAVLIFIAIFLVEAPLVLLATLLPHPQREWMIFWLLKIYAEIYLLLTFVRKKIYFVPEAEERHRVLLPTHHSYMDPVALYVSTIVPFRSLGKMEIAKVPIIGYFIKQALILVDRDSGESRIRAYKRMNKELSYTDICVFPQGTFEEDQFFIPKVYSGGFRLAQSNGCDILPIILLDTQRMLSITDTIHMSPGLCRVIYLTPLRYTDIRDISTDRLMLLYIAYIEDSLEFIREHEIEYLRDHSRLWLTQNLDKYK